MALKAGGRPGLGERIAPGEVRPASNKLILWLGVGVVVLVTLAILAIIWASASTKFPKVVDNNTPHQLSPSAVSSTPAASATP